LLLFQTAFCGERFPSLFIFFIRFKGLLFFLFVRLSV
jgi:hypothetical protein